MCGIAGFAAKEDIFHWDQLSRMKDSLVHRGPDGYGQAAWTQDDMIAGEGKRCAAGLGHRRLSIIDLSDSGSQPMANEDDSVWISFNGEFYNFSDHRSELATRGHVFKSRCDTEVILHLYEEVGIDETLKRMNGMFAFGLWDRPRRQLVLARDRLGQKPLYYIHRPDGSIIFASEIKAFLNADLIDPQRIDPVALHQFWTFGYTMGDRTIFEEVRQLPAGHLARWSNGNLRVEQYWDAPFGQETVDQRSMDELADELEALLADAITIRLMADVPLGLFLSGGIDSSVIAALTNTVSDTKPASFTVSFDHQAFSEAHHAKRIADHLGISNTELRVEEDMMGIASAIARQFDEPFGDSSAIPTYFVSKAAREHVAVVLTGDCGDELFAGYPWHKTGLKLWGNANYRNAVKGWDGWRDRLWALKLWLSGFEKGYCSLGQVTGTKVRENVFSEWFRESVDLDDVIEGRIRWHRQVRHADALSQMQYVDLKTYMVDDILVKVDRMSMASSLEARCPFLDHRVVEFAAHLPRHAKIDAEGRGKAILRQILSRYVPPQLFERPKQGFTIPWEHWCTGRTAAEFRNRWSSMNSEYLNPMAADMIFPEQGIGSPHLQWNAFAMLEWLQARSGADHDDLEQITLPLLHGS